VLSTPSSVSWSCSPDMLFCDNETNLLRLYGVSTGPRWPKDGINDHVVSGADTVNPQRRGSKCAVWYRVSVPPGETTELRLRLRPVGGAEDPAIALGADFTRIAAERRAEADRSTRSSRRPQRRPTKPQ
jgi:hypothetical protein